MIINDKNKDSCSTTIQIFASHRFRWTFQCQGQEKSQDLYRCIHLPSHESHSFGISFKPNQGGLHNGPQTLHIKKRSP